MCRRSRFYSLLLIPVLLLAACGGQSSPRASVPVPTTNAVDIPNSIDTIVNDMKLPHEGLPHGVPTSYGWEAKPEIEMGNSPGTFQAMVPWGQLYEDTQGNPATNTRVQIRNIQAYMLSKQDGKWHLLTQSLLVQGAAYVEDFSNDTNKPANVRTESDGSISVTAGGGYNFHFWAPNRVTIDPNDIAGIFTTVQARLVVNNASLPDDRNKARYLLDMGGDYWLSLTAQWDNFKTNGGIAIGRFKYVKPGWQSFNMTTLPEAAIRSNPPLMQ